jgi:hypothetical protein
LGSTWKAEACSRPTLAMVSGECSTTCARAHAGRHSLGQGAEGRRPGAGCVVGLQRTVLGAASSRRAHHMGGGGRQKQAPGATRLPVIQDDPAMPEQGAVQREGLVLAPLATHVAAVHVPQPAARDMAMLAWLVAQRSALPPPVKAHPHPCSTAGLGRRRWGQRPPPPTKSKGRRAVRQAGGAGQGRHLCSLGSMAARLWPRCLCGSSPMAATLTSTASMPLPIMPLAEGGARVGGWAGSATPDSISRRGGMHTGVKACTQWAGSGKQRGSV